MLTVFGGLRLIGADLWSVFGGSEGRLWCFLAVCRGSVLPICGENVVSCGLLLSSALALPPGGSFAFWVSRFVSMTCWKYVGQLVHNAGVIGQIPLGKGVIGWGVTFPVFYGVRAKTNSGVTPLRKGR